MTSMKHCVYKNSMYITIIDKDVIVCGNQFLLKHVTPNPVCVTATTNIWLLQNKIND